MDDTEDLTHENIYWRADALASAFAAAGIPPNPLTAIALMAVVNALLLCSHEMEDIPVPPWLVEWRNARGGVGG
jgi:hypothetical protein